MKPTPTDLTELHIRGCKPLLYAKNIKVATKVLAVVCIASSFLIPDLGVGLVVGSALLSGLPLSLKFKSLKHEIKTRWRLR